jgi:ferredoxin
MILISNVCRRAAKSLTTFKEIGYPKLTITVLAYNSGLAGACEGSLACSTCHVIVDPEYYNKLEEPTDEENDMLDLAFGLTETYVS